MSEEKTPELVALEAYAERLWFKETDSVHVPADPEYQQLLNAYHTLFVRGVVQTLDDMTDHLEPDVMLKVWKVVEP